jgi:hypothetical protein
MLVSRDPNSLSKWVFDDLVGPESSVLHSSLPLRRILRIRADRRLRRGYHEPMTSLTAQRSPATVRRDRQPS